MLPFFCPTLRGGGELDPREDVPTLADAEGEERVARYVGRRTGRRSIANGGGGGYPANTAAAARSSAATSSPRPSASSRVVAMCSGWTEWLSSVAMSSETGIVYVHALGELLHILRPLYWSAETYKWRMSASSSSAVISDRRRQPPLIAGPLHHSFSIWKAWFVSLLMDLISDRLLRARGYIEERTPPDRLGGPSSLHGRGGGVDRTHLRPPTSVERAKLDELDWRRRRHRSYLLRSPAYDAATRPMAVILGRIISSIPSFGMGRWASGYVLDMMDYWNDNHFMLES